MQRFGDPPRRGVRYTERAGAYAVLEHGGRLLVTFQELPLAEFQLPGGGIDPGEGAIRALHREVREETGWSIHIQRRLGVYQRYTYMPDYDLWARKLCHVYLGRPTLRHGAPSEPHHSAVWLDPDDAASKLASSGDAWFTRQALGL